MAREAEIRATPREKKGGWGCNAVAGEGRCPSRQCRRIREVGVEATQELEVGPAPREKEGGWDGGERGNIRERGDARGVG